MPPPRSRRAQRPPRPPGTPRAQRAQTSGRRRAEGPRPNALRGLGLASLLALIIAANAGALQRTREFLDFGAGVLALVSLTATVLWGLAATDRMLLDSGHRLLAQAVHRGTAVGGLGFLGLHIWVKVAEGRTSATAALVPFTDVGKPLLIGLGTLAGYLFLVAAITGAVRSAFASRGRSRWWRALHMCAYLAWCAALVHGLRSGRAAADWAVAGYLLALAGTGVALALRLVGPRSATTAAVRGRDGRET